MPTVLGDFMAKRKRRSATRQRDTFAISRPLLLPRRIRKPMMSLQLTPSYDRRRFNPDPLPFPRRRDGTFAVIDASTPRKSRSRKSRTVPHGLAFKNPRGVIVCARRSERRQVLFARGVGGSTRRKNKPQRTPDSAISCR